MADGSGDGHGDVYVVLAGVPTRCYLLSFRLSYSGNAVQRVLRSAARRRSSKATSTR
jgi:hypothetical protein